MFGIAGGQAGSRGEWDNAFLGVRCLVCTCLVCFFEMAKALLVTDYCRFSCVDWKDVKGTCQLSRSVESMGGQRSKTRTACWLGLPMPRLWQHGIVGAVVITLFGATSCALVEFACPCGALAPNGSAVILLFVITSRRVVQYVVRKEISQKCSTRHICALLGPIRVSCDLLPPFPRWLWPEI